MSWPAFTVLAALIVAFLCLWSSVRWLKKQRSWGGNFYNKDTAQPYYWLTATSKGSPVASWLGVPFTCPFDFVLEPEGRLHYVSESFGFCTKLQSNDPNFDKDIYVCSDDATLQHKLRDDMTLHTLIIKAFTLGAARIYSTPSKLSVKMKAATFNVPGNGLIETLYGIKERLPALSSTGEVFVPANNLWLVVFTAWPEFLLCWAVLTGILCISGSFSIMNYGPIWSLAWRVAAAIIAGTFIAARMIFHGSSYGHRIFAGYLKIGVASTLLACFCTLADINCFYETSEPVIQVVPIVYKNITYEGKHNTPVYHLGMELWNGAPARRYSIEVSPNIYARAKINGKVHLYTYPGYLGAEWIGKKEVESQ